MGAEIGTKSADLTIATYAEPVGATPHSEAPIAAPDPQPASSHTVGSLLREKLTEEPSSFDFLQAVTLLQRLNPTASPVGGFFDPANEAVHFQVNPRLGFPVHDIQSVTFAEDKPAQMVVNFMGLTGPSGVLPYPYSELILDRARERDHTLAAFFDIFNHRAISLFYRAWQKFHFPVTHGAEKGDFFNQYMLDLLGLGTRGLRDRQDIEDEVLLHYVSLLGRQTRSAVALEQILVDYFDVPMEIQEFTGSWRRLDRLTQCEMNGAETASQALGDGAVLGDAMWDRQGRVRIRIGPMTMDRYIDFLPEGLAFRRLRAITQFFGNHFLDFEAQLVLHGSEAPEIELDFDAQHPARLGWVSWASTKPMSTNPDDTVLPL